jgi:hypothetical protein
MEATDIITIISVFAVIVGWFTNSKLNRDHEIFKKRLDYKLDMYKSYIEVSVHLEDMIQKANAGETVPEKTKFEYINKLTKVQVKFLILGDKDEIELINNIVVHCNANDLPKLKNESVNLSLLVREKWRNAVGLKKI